MRKYNTIIGLEIHAELKTFSKMFCGCKNDPFNAPKPNVFTCPVCLGLPGALPVANKKAIEWTIKVGLALNCEINLFSKFDRKHYFYPDLPKGYQISQYDIPFCRDGYLETSEGKVRIRRIHLEEDTAKLLHTKVDGKEVSLIDFNRSGVPLMEIVTEPDIKTPSQAKEFGKSLRQILRYLDVADCDMQEGGMRLEANVSMQKAGQTELPNYKVELKNINSFRFMEQAVEYEMKRHTSLLENGETPTQETRGWNSATNVTFSQRTKEEAEDYRYFPDPDLPPIRFSQDQIDTLKAEIPELPAEKEARWVGTYNVEHYYAKMIAQNLAEADWHEKAFIAAQTGGSVSPNEVAKATVNKKIKYSLSDDPAGTVQLVKALLKTEKVSEDQLDSAIQKVIDQNQDAVAKYKAGETKVIGFFIGQIMRELDAKADVNQVRTALLVALSNA